MGLGGCTEHIKQLICEEKGVGTYHILMYNYLFLKMSHHTYDESIGLLYFPRFYFLKTFIKAVHKLMLWAAAMEALNLDYY